MMGRLAIYLGGVSAAMAAFVCWHNKWSAGRKVPVQKAAAMLQEAWADHHTRA